MKHFAPAAERNKAAILAVLKDALPTRGTVLEVASGSGQHAVYFAEHLAPLAWQPTDQDRDQILSIDAWRDEYALPNLRAARQLDVARAGWASTELVPTGGFDAVVCINMIHISPWAATESLFAGLNAALGGTGMLVLYGPFKRQGVPTAPSNTAFDASLRSQNPAWGIRDLERVVALANQQRFTCDEVIEMPANNLSVLFSIAL